MKTLNLLFEKSVEKYPDNVLLKEKWAFEYQSYTYREIRKEVHRFAAGLIHLGIEKGDRLSLYADGRKDWLISELGILYAGACNVPISVRLEEPAELIFRFKHSGTKMIVVSGNIADRIKKIKKDLPDLEKVILLDKQDSYEDDEILFDDVCKKGDEILANDIKRFEERWTMVNGDDYANICYTSGTTADPKGIILSHRNYTANIEQSRSLMPVPEWYTSLIILPWDHAFAHTTGLYTLISAGASMASVQVGRTMMETLKNIPTNIREIKPTILMSVPAYSKAFKKNIEKGVREKGAFLYAFFKHAVKLAIWYNGIGWDRGKGLKILVKPLIAFYDIILFRKVREGFGGRLKFFVGGGALLDIELQKFFYAIGMPIFQGYGLTEAAPVISSNSEEKHKLGSSGYLVDNLELTICDEDGRELETGEKGEIVVKGENVMIGYWKNKEASREVLKNGKLFTGDMGYMDEDGFLYVLGRFKSLLIADDGEKYSPEGIEEAFIEKVPFIDQCMMVNNQNPYSVLMVVPNKEAMKSWARQGKMEPSDEETKKAILEELLRQLSEFRKGGAFTDEFPQRWMPAAIAILPEGFTAENQLMNFTNKMVRGKVVEKYQDKLDFLFTPEAKIITNKNNLDALGDL